MREEIRFTNFHHIQKSIILSLSKKSPQKFSELKPPRLANNTFSYHLKKLLEANYIEPSENGYILTRRALKNVIYGPSSFKDKGLLKTITMVIVINSNNEILLLNRSDNPFKGWYGIPSGVIHFSETIKDAAKREIYEKTSISTDCSALNHLGVLEFRYKNSETADIFIHAIAFVFSLKLDGEHKELNELENKYGQLSWSMLGREHILPEVFTAIEMSTSGSCCCYVTKEYNEPSNIPVFAA